MSEEREATPWDGRLTDLADEDYEVGRRAVEDVLIGFRDERISLLNRGNGLVIREKDGTESSTIRLGTEAAIRIAVEAILASHSATEEER